MYLVEPALEDGGAAVLVVEEGSVEGVRQDDAHAARLGARSARPEEGVRPSAVVLEALDPAEGGDEVGNVKKYLSFAPLVANSALKGSQCEIRI